VNTEIEPFGWINPCGLTGVSVTSMKKMLEKEVPMDEVRRQARIHTEHILGMRLVPISFDETLSLIDRAPIAEGTAGF
jgi:lipoyl(octanoyl) transferase